MAFTTEQVECPRNPEHGIATKRWLPSDDRQMIAEAESDVFEIDCPVCGKYEHKEEQARK